MKKVLVLVLSFMMILLYANVCMAYIDFQFVETGKGSIEVLYNIDSEEMGVIGEYGFTDQLKANASYFTNDVYDTIAAEGLYLLQENLAIDFGVVSMDSANTFFVEGAMNFPLSEGLYAQGRVGLSIYESSNTVTFGGSLVYEQDALLAYGDLDIVDSDSSLSFGAEYSATEQMLLHLYYVEDSTEIGIDYNVTENVSIGLDYNIDAETTTIGAEFGF